MTIDKTTHLNAVLETHKMKHIEDLLNEYKTKRDEVKEFLEKKYKSKAYNIINSGSYAKHTAINSKFDLDILVPFKRDSFETLENMFNDVFNLLEEEYSNQAIIKAQKVSIGIEFYPNDNGEVISLDIVPGRELNQDQYSKDNNVNLYVNSKFGELDEKSYIQTNIQIQINHIKAKENERKIVRLLKVWKTNNNKNYKSFLIELLVIKAFDKLSVEGSLWEKLKIVLNYINENIAKDSFTLLDPGNSNNDVIDSLDSWAKDSFKKEVSDIIQRIDDNEEYLNIYFPINEDYKEEKVQTNNSYGFSGAVITPSILSKKERFG